MQKIFPNSLIPKNKTVHEVASHNESYNTAVALPIEPTTLVKMPPPASSAKLFDCVCRRGCYSPGTLASHGEIASGIGKGASCRGPDESP